MAEEEVVLPSEEPVVLTLEEQIAALTKERDNAVKSHKELEVQMGRKAQEAGDARKKEQEAMAQAERQNSQKEYIASIVDDVVSGGMVITEEMQTKLTDLGIDANTVRLSAYEHKEKIDGVVKVFGNRETYNEAVNFGAEKGVTQAELAAIGLKTLYAQSSGEVSTERIAGNSNPIPPQRGYATKEEYSRDYAFAGRDPIKLKMVREKVSQTKQGILE